MSSIDLLPIPIPAPTTVAEFRTSKLRPFGPVQSGIDKQTREGKLFVAQFGLPDDEHDLTFHGGIDKAVHQYNSNNYAFWRSLFPTEEIAEKFVPGGFGENIVAAGHDETNICIGDLIRIGPEGSNLIGGSNGCLLEVSLPRQPCFKLNQRFGIKNFAPRTHQNAKTGWYYRVKEQGWVEKGMEIRVVERPFPRWSIDRLHHYVHRDKKDLDVTQELMHIAVMGDECRGVFERRWEEHTVKEEPEQRDVWRKFKVVSKINETPRIVRLELEAIKRAENPAKFVSGSHALIQLPNGLKRAYSLIGGDEDQISFGIARHEHGRGGSVYIHDNLSEGDGVLVGSIKQTIVTSPMASHHIYIIGGIGITAFILMFKRQHATNQSFHVHYAVRDTDEVAFLSLFEQFESNTKIYIKSKGERINIRKIIENRPWNSHIYTCGPQRMIDDVLAHAKKAGMSEDEIHYETFTPGKSGDPFSVRAICKGSTTKIEIPGDKSLLEVLRDTGFEVGSSCEVGTCGTCRIPVKSGSVEHQGSALTAEEQEEEMLPCVSRGIGEIVIEIPEN